MPIYLFKHPEKDEYIEIFQSMKDKHEYFDENGLMWERRWTIPYASIDTKINPWDNKDFIRKTENKKGTIGEMMDLSSELSESRAKSDGKEDPLRRKYFNKYSEERRGAVHHLDRKKVIENKNVKIEL